MRRKDCDNLNGNAPLRPWRIVAATAGIIASMMLTGADVRAGSIRVWPSAAVAEESVRLADLCELTGFSEGVEKRIADLVITYAPPQGGSRLVHIDMIRDAVMAADVNMAEVTLRGSTQCTVSRPSQPEPVVPEQPVASSADHVNFANLEQLIPAGDAENAATPERTIRQAVIDYFNDELVRYGGKAEVHFDRGSEQLLGLTSPPYHFEVRRRKGNPLGLTSVAVRVLADGAVVQTVPLVVQVTLHRQAIVAKHAINQGATVRPSDVSLVSVSVSRLDRGSLNDLAAVVGQRAKRFVSVGSLIESDWLEQVPLVHRGQLVTLSSVSGGIRVVTSGKAIEAGLLGDVITIRSVTDRRVSFDAVVVGPGAVEVSLGANDSKKTHLARWKRS